MNGLQGNFDQAAGNNWGSPSHLMLHEFIEIDQSRDIDFSYANSMFDDLERQMRASEAEFQSSLKLLREKYVFSNPDAVEYFIKTHRVVASVLMEAAPQLAKAFGSKVHLALEIMAEEGTPQVIYALVIWNQNVSIARAALQTFDREWLTKNLQAINGRIVFDYELI